MTWYSRGSRSPTRRLHSASSRFVDQAMMSCAGAACRAAGPIPGMDHSLALVWALGALGDLDDSVGRLKAGAGAEVVACPVEGVGAGAGAELEAGAGAGAELEAGAGARAEFDAGAGAEVDGRREAPARELTLRTAGSLLPFRVGEGWPGCCWLLLLLTPALSLAVAGGRGAASGRAVAGGMEAASGRAVAGRSTSRRRTGLMGGATPAFAWASGDCVPA